MKLQFVGYPFIVSLFLIFSANVLSDEIPCEEQCRVGEVGLFAHRLTSCFLPADGRTLSAFDYPALAAVIGKGETSKDEFSLPEIDGDMVAGICVDGRFPAKKMLKNLKQLPTESDEIQIHNRTMFDLYFSLNSMSYNSLRSYDSTIFKKLSNKGGKDFGVGANRVIVSNSMSPRQAGFSVDISQAHLRERGCSLYLFSTMAVYTCGLDEIKYDYN